MRALACPGCKGLSNAPVSRMLRYDYRCDDCFRADNLRYQRKRTEEHRQKTGKLREKFPDWTPAEDEAIRNGARELPGRTRAAVRVRRHRLQSTFWNMTPYSDADRRFVMRHYKTKTYAWIGEQIGRDLKSVTSFLQRNGLGSGPKKRAKLHKLTERQRKLIPAVVDAEVPKTLPKIIRGEIVNMMILDALERRLAFAAIKGAFATYRTRYYAMHPIKGAPVSLDTPMFDDGYATLGDRISSDVNMWERAA